MQDGFVRIGQIFCLYSNNLAIRHRLIQERTDEHIVAILWQSAAIISEIDNKFTISPLRTFEEGFDFVPVFFDESPKQVAKRSRHAGLDPNVADLVGQFQARAIGFGFNRPDFFFL